jgi:hypothetical protein
LPDFVFNEAAFMEFVNDPAGGLANELRTQADFLVEETKAHLKSNVADPKEARSRNPTNVPRYVTGTLHDSIGASEPELVDGLIAIGIGADPTIAPYAGVLLGREAPRSGRDPRDFQLAPDRIAHNQ